VLVLLEHLQAGEVDPHDPAHLDWPPLVRVVPSVPQVVAQVLLDPLPLHPHPELPPQPLLHRALRRLKQSLVLGQTEVGLLPPAKVVDGCFSLVRLVERVLLSEDQYSEQLQPPVETVELARSVGHRVQHPDIGEVFSDCQFGELHRPEESPFSILKKLAMHKYPLVVVVPEFLGSP
jgi:hypothetical protein